MKYNWIINPQNVIVRKKKGSAKNGKPPNIIGICSYCVLVFEWTQILLHPELTPCWSFLFADGAHHKKPHSPTHPVSKMKDILNMCVWLLYSVTISKDIDIHNIVMWIICKDTPTTVTEICFDLRLMIDVYQPTLMNNNSDIDTAQLTNSAH